MNILVANLGSTSFKYRLYRFTATDEVLLSQGGFERVTAYRPCIEEMLEKLKSEGHLQEAEDLDAVGFKTVLGKDVSGCLQADDRVLQALEDFKEVAPAHNPAYAEGIRCFAEKLPTVPRVALFETAFYQWIKPENYEYAIPESWRKLGIRRYGFHGASHKFIAERSAQLLGNEAVSERVKNLYLKGPGNYDGNPCRVISCHLGGSSSVTGIENGIAIGTSMGFSPQSGLPQNNRVGDLDSMAIPYAMKKLGISIEAAETELNKASGLLGLSGVSNDLRDILEASEVGNSRAELAIQHLVESIRHWAGSFLFKMGGLEALCFTAGIGENNAALRQAVCRGLEGLGIQLDVEKNNALTGEGMIQSSNSRTKIMVIPANEELVIAREVARLVGASKTN